MYQKHFTGGCVLNIGGQHYIENIIKK